MVEALVADADEVIRVERLERIAHALDPCLHDLRVAALAPRFVREVPREYRRVVFVRDAVEGVDAVRERLERFLKNLYSGFVGEEVL